MVHLSWGACVTYALQLLPPPTESLAQTALNLSSQPWSSGTTGRSVDLATRSRTICIDKGLAFRRDTGGLTLIPPTGLEFAQLFANDLTALSGTTWTVQLQTDESNSACRRGIVLGTSSINATYENGTPTEEGYELRVSDEGIFIGGTGARGIWWGTRTLLQMLLIHRGTLPIGQHIDYPAYATRGYMLDAGRKWYSPSFLKEVCVYASFFKISEFHYHLSDNYPLNRGHNETWQKVYSQFALRPEDPALAWITERENETLSRRDFEDLQSHCAARGVTVIPEIEAPGHSLYITKHKPELALTKKDLLNLTHPDTIPTVQSIWAEFLPWFQTKEVHIGADEYDATLSDVYISFVNEMAAFVNQTAGKRVRIWGTEEPSQDREIAKEVIIQHWQLGQSDPVALAEAGYDIINSEDWWAYMSLKNDHMPILPAPYAQFFNESRIFRFANQEGWQWSPNDIDAYNPQRQMPVGAARNKGAILAAWNDNGPDASTQLEAYYAMRRGIPLVASRAWSGVRGPLLVETELDPSVDFFSPHAPAQNLDRVVPSKAGSEPLLTWERDGGIGSENSTVSLGYGSKGLNYTLTLDITGPFELVGPDNALFLDSSGSLVFTSDGWPYPLRSVSSHDALHLDPGMPGRIWTNVTSSAHVPVIVSTPARIVIVTEATGGSRVWLNGKFAGRFEVFVFGGRNTLFSWSQMAFVAPLDTLRGGIQRLVLEDAVKLPCRARD
ncbi:putative beta-N-hexosaminidase [Thozetella sp. PMI_491]|nr:putative beta-N-hexosaminidase [Thozetella sp. PMI_491]